MVLPTVVDMPSKRSLTVRFAHPVVKSISRKPTTSEFLHMNLLENHAERCSACRPLLYNESPWHCSLGQRIENLVLNDFVLDRKGRIHSTLEDGEYHIQVEIARHYDAVHTLLRQFHGRH
jgi:hypothetical protein